METIRIIILLCTALPLCNASCGVETCEPPQEFGYASCSDFNRCLMDPQRGGCTKRNRNLLMLPQCSCYMVCERSFKLLFENPKQSYCYYRGLLHECLTSNHVCFGITSHYLQNFTADCPCDVENCLNGDGGFPYETSCYHHLMCLGNGPVASDAAGCSSAEAVRKKMNEKRIHISNPNGTWVLKKNCHCINSCPGEVFHLLPSCRRIQELIACYQRVGCSIKKFKKRLAPCLCEHLCKSEIYAMNELTNGTKEEFCEKSLKYETCKKSYGCMRRVSNICSGKSGQYSSKWPWLNMVILALYTMMSKRL